ncbi:tRNA N6-adenosine threonylcarbamoyltransferase [Cucumispora dikerogammari]|nr:tRNA N6-adenosine threonylcarbamoyltransferase [Cucumispora dikerogammari]
MITLGIEGSANKLGISILDNTEILCNLRETFHNLPGEGFRPSELAVHHSIKILPLIKKALKESNKQLKDIKLIAFTRGPGIASPLNICAIVARTLAIKLNIDIISVNHCIAHIEMGRFVTKLYNPVILYASGANTQIICYQSTMTNLITDKYRGKGKYVVLGEALDIAVGNCLDRVARLLNIPNAPSPGFNIEEYAKKGKTFYLIPVPIKGMDISCSGIVEFIKRKFLSSTKLSITDELKYDICFSLQENLFAALTEVTERAMSLFKSSEVLIVGGVGCNLRLQEMISLMARDRNAVVGNMDDSFCVDNGAMIAYTGYVMYKSGVRTKIEVCDISQRYRTESVEITWP